MCYFTLLFGIGLFVNFVNDAEAQNVGEVVLYSGDIFQGFGKAYPFEAGSCVGKGSGFPSPLNESVGSLKTDHLIAVYPEPDCAGSVQVKLGAGSYPDLHSLLRNQEPSFKKVIKSFFMIPFQQDTVEIFSRQETPGQRPSVLLTLLVADIDHAYPCFKFNDATSRKIGGVDNHLNCLKFFTGTDCQGRNFKVEGQEKFVSFQDYVQSETYSGMKLCSNDVNGPGKDVGRLKAAHVNVTLVDNSPFDKPS